MVKKYAQFFLLVTIPATLMYACKKQEPLHVASAERTVDQLLKDSVYYYYNLYSLWSNAEIADVSGISAFTKSYNSSQSVLDALKATTPAHLAYNGHIDRFSYLEYDGSNPEYTSTNSAMAGIAGNAGSSYGIYLSIGAVSEKAAYPIVYFIEGGSPAEKAGITRSDIVMEVQDQDLGIPVSCESGACKITDQPRQQAVINKLLSAMEQTGMQMKVKHADESEFLVSISAAKYEINPIVADTVLAFASKRVGYLALSSFEDVSEGKLNRFRLENVFDSFENNQIKDLILDIRYNTGGYVSAAEYVANRVISQNAGDALMYKFQLNSYLSQRSHWKGQSFDDVHFRRQNALNLNTVYFLVSDITASAAELLINVLRPHMNVVIIAEHDGTYGKPVGFFKQEILGKASLWVASFKLLNSRNESDYWDGIGADQRNVMDDIFHDFGDPNEAMLSAALNQSVGRVKPAASSLKLRPSQRISSNIQIGQVNAVPQKFMLK